MKQAPGREARRLAQPLPEAISACRTVPHREKVTYVAQCARDLVRFLAEESRAAADGTVAESANL